MVDTKIEEEVEKFLEDIIQVCERHGFSFSHQDSQGAFIIEEFDDNNIKWLKAAEINL